MGQSAHCYKYEGGGAAVLGSIQPQPLSFTKDGTIDLDQAQAAVKPDDDHFARTKLFCLENTVGGRALPLDYLSQAAQFAKRNKLGLHLDGARIFNAAIQCKVDVSELSAPFDTVSVCFSKGLGAPVGSMLCGDDQTVRRARRWRKLLGGGMRQAGVVAAAALYALENHVERLIEDHEMAKWIAEKLGKIDEIEVVFHPMQTNMVFVKVDNEVHADLVEYLGKREILLYSDSPIRIVCHLDIDRGAAKELVAGFKAFFRNHRDGLRR